MPKTSHSSEDQHDQHTSPHDWHSPDYVANWAAKQDQKERDRQEAFCLMTEKIPYDRTLPFKILDIGAGYGALTHFLLHRFLNATAICMDNSEEMTQLGFKRMADLKGRFVYVFADFRHAGWSRNIQGSVEAAVSSIAIHGAREPDIIRSIYKELFPLIKAGGCFFNFEIPTRWINIWTG